MAHPLSRVLPRIGALLEDTMRESGCFAAFCDADGVLLWSEGPSAALQSAVGPRFLPGFPCREDQIGTNALGTALVLDQPVQIFSAEHFNQLLHGWACAAAPVHDPDSGEQIGAIDLTGAFRTAHVHTVGLVAAIARTAEAWLGADRRSADDALVEAYHREYGTKRQRYCAVVNGSGRVVHCEPAEWLGPRVEVSVGVDRWPQPDGTMLCARPLGDGFVVGREHQPQPRQQRISVSVLGRDRALMTAAARARRELQPRHSEIVALLALHPQGMTVRELAQGLYGDAAREATVRAEIVRLRRLLGDIVLSRPYRLSPRVEVDVAAAARQLATGSAPGCVRRCPGPLLPSSTAPGVVEARNRLAGDVPRRWASTDATFAQR